VCLLDWIDEQYCEPTQSMCPRDHVISNTRDYLLEPLCFFKRNTVGEAPTVFFYNKNSILSPWGLELGWLGCTSTSLTMWARLTSYFVFPKLCINKTIGIYKMIWSHFFMSKCFTNILWKNFKHLWETLRNERFSISTSSWIIYNRFTHLFKTLSNISKA
jgi:hypothetical protein